MLIPRRVKHRKQHHPKRTGFAKGGTSLAFGDFGIQAVEGHYVTNRQIESARIAMTRHIKRGGKVWINIYPDRPLTKKLAETLMGSGKGSPEWWIANVKPGRVMFELSGVPEDIAREAMRRAMNSCNLGSLLVPTNAEARGRSDGIAGSMPNQIMQVRFGSICCSGCAARPEARSQRLSSGRRCIAEAM